MNAEECAAELPLTGIPAGYPPRLTARASDAQELAS